MSDDFSRTTDPATGPIPAAQQQAQQQPQQQWTQQPQWVQQPPPSAPAKTGGGIGALILGAVVIIALLGGIGFWIGRATSGDGGAPAACREAVGEARQVFTIVGEGMSIMGRSSSLASEAIQAAADRDVSRMQEITVQIKDNTAQLDANTAKLKGLDFQRLASECEGAS